MLYVLQSPFMGFISSPLILKELFWDIISQHWQFLCLHGFVEFLHLFSAMFLSFTSLLRHDGPVHLTKFKILGFGTVFDVGSDGGCGVESGEGSCGMGSGADCVGVDGSGVGSGA